MYDDIAYLFLNERIIVTLCLSFVFYMLNGSVFITLLYYILIPLLMLIFIFWSNQTPDRISTASS